MYLSDIAALLNLNVTRDAAICGFEQDSRKVEKGFLFFAIKGEKTDGHHFLREVALRGAYAAVVSHSYAGEDFGLVLLHVADVLDALQSLARQVQQRRNPRVIGVTGSVGKTTTKEFIAGLLEARFKVAKTPGNANSQVSMALSILNESKEHEVFVMEMGMSQKGEMQRLVSIAPPEIAVITPITHAHVLFFPDGVEGIAHEKARILSHPQTRLGIASAQAARFSVVRDTGSCEKILCGQKDYVFDGMCVLERGVKSPILPFPFEATHVRDNFLIAVAVARAMGLSWEDIVQQAPQLQMVAKRFEKTVRDGITFINDSYNANALSMKAALQNLPTAKEGKKTIGVLGAMKELGPYTEELHREVAECALQYVDQLICLGQECQVMVDFFVQNDKKAELYPNLASVKEKVFAVAEEGDVILLKGSRSNELWRILD
jgi:UDP-N-acetylmuramoyl-tripeptide--D-alanyl-D-alanine ligase